MKQICIDHDGGKVTFIRCRRLEEVASNEQGSVARILIVLVQGEWELWALDDSFGEGEVMRYYRHFGIEAEKVACVKPHSWYRPLAFKEE